MTPQPVDVEGLGGSALDWLKVLVVTDLALGLTVVLVLVAVAVVWFWRGG